MAPLAWLLVWLLAAGSAWAPAGGQQCGRPERQQYRLFGTKTMYEEARARVQRDNAPGEPQLERLPSSFGAELSLEALHRRLLASDASCQARGMYFAGRHSARFPDADDIELYRTHVARLQAELASSSACARALASYLEWKPVMGAQLDNLITEPGAREERDIARRLKRLYPALMDGQQAQLTTGVTSRLRAAQTGAEFLGQLDNWRQANCSGRLAQLPTNDVLRAEHSVERIRTDACYSTLMAQHARRFLEFHLDCEQIEANSSTGSAGPGGRPKKPVSEPRVGLVKDGRVLASIGVRMARRLGLSGQAGQTLTGELVDSLFGVCKFESAYSRRGSSIWCDLFDRQDVQALEYAEDVKSYVKNAYGPEANSRQACPLLRDLLDSLQAAAGAPSGSKPRSTFHFYHAGPMKKLLAALGLFANDTAGAFAPATVERFVREARAPNVTREWRDSLALPFSANALFVLYRCSGRHLVAAAVTERPVLLPVCGGKDLCELDTFLAGYSGARECNLNSICAKRPPAA